MAGIRDGALIQRRAQEVSRYRELVHMFAGPATDCQQQIARLPALGRHRGEPGPVVVCVEQVCREGDFGELGIGA
jgi:hypothetical protein